MALGATQTSLPGVWLLEPRKISDARGFFFESYNARAFADATGVSPVFVQDNHSRSAKGVLRGLHYQIQHAQGKLVRVSAGRILDVAVDLRKSSPHFGRWVAEELSSENNRQLWIPPGFAHGFVVTSDHAEVLYKTSELWHPEHERVMLWNDPCLCIDWRLDGAMPQLSSADAAGRQLADAQTYP